jgi:UDP-N-acetylmuramyl pentapeptide phosphotransferase/UDP-N-acetylglucosamine-1-phosphate transferase
MAFVFIIVGVVFLIAGVRGTQDQLWSLLQGDFSPSKQQQGQHSFLAWFAAIMVIGAIGYIDDLKELSRSFLVLIIIVLFLSNNGFFAQLQKIEQGSGNAGTTGT